MMKTRTKTMTEGRPSLLGRLVLLTGFIPRGKGKAPDASHPVVGSADDLARGVAGLRGKVEAVGTRLGEVEACAGRTTHPLGDFTPAQWLRFIDLHHLHHFKIIRDIRKAAGG